MPRSGERVSVMRYVFFRELPDGNLSIELTVDGKEELQERLARGDAEVDITADLFEYEMGNGWDYVDPAEIGALTDALIVSHECERNDVAELERLGRVYWNPNYMIVGDLDLETLLRDGKVTWKGCD